MDSVINDKWWYAANSTRAAGATATHTLTWRTPNVGITIITMIDVDDNRCWIRNWKLVIVHALGNFFFYLWRKTNSCRISVGSIADRYAITEQKPTEKTNKLLFHFHFVSFLLFSLCLSLSVSLRCLIYSGKLLMVAAVRQAFGCHHSSPPAFIRSCSIPHLSLDFSSLPVLFLGRNGFLQTSICMHLRAWFINDALRMCNACIDCAWMEISHYPSMSQ